MFFCQSSLLALSFIVSVVQKLAVRGYEYHLYDLLLCLNFNGYYDTKRTTLE